VKKLYSAVPALTRSSCKKQYPHGNLNYVKHPSDFVQFFHTPKTPSSNLNYFEFVDIQMLGYRTSKSIFDLPTQHAPKIV